MNRSLVVAAAVFVLGVLVAERALSAVNPPGNERRSMGNLRNTEPSNPNPAARPHRPWSYGNPPYYRRPPTTPYYVVPQPVYPYRYGTYRYPYPYWYRQYNTTPYPWGPKIYYPVPYWAY